MDVYVVRCILFKHLCSFKKTEKGCSRPALFTSSKVVLKKNILMCHSAVLRLVWPRRQMQFDTLTLKKVSVCCEMLSRLVRTKTVNKNEKDLFKMCFNVTWSLFR